MSFIKKPAIQSVSIAPNPVDANTQYLLAVVVTEIDVEIEPVIIYCGTFMCGEEAI